MVAGWILVHLRTPGQNSASSRMTRPTSRDAIYRGRVFDPEVIVPHPGRSQCTQPFVPGWSRAALAEKSTRAYIKGAAEGAEFAAYHQTSMFTDLLTVTQPR